MRMRMRIWEKMVARANRSEGWQYQNNESIYESLLFTGIGSCPHGTAASLWYQQKLLMLPCLCVWSVCISLLFLPDSFLSSHFQPGVRKESKS